MSDTLTAKQLSSAFIFATEWLGVHVDEVNALNVYPVPDGDTGTNMHLTMQSVRRELSEQPAHSFAELSHALSYGSLLGARGNSGVILSQILKGFAEGIKALDELDATGLVTALQLGVKTAYAAVMKPVEGTILTVVRAIADSAEAGLGSQPRTLDLLNHAIAEGHVTLEHTPELLPMLKEAGVVDSGGLGLLRLFEGLIGYFEKKELPPPPKVTVRAQQFFEEEEFGFCTEFLLADSAVTANHIKELVEPYGDSLLVVGAEGFIKGHIHTEEPEKLLALVGRHGRMVRSKVEDMSEQHSEILADGKFSLEADHTTGLVAVANGYGITRVFRSFGARVVGGGQTDNPSVEDIVDVVNSIEAPEIIIMPNNSNIIMAAERAAELVTTKTVTVLPTRTIGQGIAAGLAFDRDATVAEQLDELVEVMNDAKTLEITRASRDAIVNGITVTEGEAIGLIDGELVAHAPTFTSALTNLLNQTASEYDIATVFHNSEIDDDEMQTVLASLSEQFPNLEFEVHAGAPELYPFLAVLE